MKNFIEKLYEWVSKNIDKLIHYLVCSWIVLACYVFLCIVIHGYAMLIGIIIAVILGVLKEICDQLDYGGFSIGDLVADGLGIATSVIIIAIGSHIC